MEFYINVPFFLIPLVTIVACAIVALVVEAIAQGRGGNVTYVFTFLVALVGAFMAIHWDYFGERDIGDLVLHGALASTIVMGLIISGLGASAGKWIYGVIHKAVATPIWRKDNEEAAIKAAQKETNVSKLHEMATDATSYRVRSIANEKLGRHQTAQYEVALHSDDEAECLAALDAVDWGEWDHLLGEIAASSPKETVAIKAVGKIRDDKALAEVAVKATNANVALQAVGAIAGDEALAEVVSKAADEQVAAKAFARIEDPATLKGIFAQTGASPHCAPSLFEVGMRTGDLTTCIKALDAALAMDPTGVAALLGSADDTAFIKSVISQWLGDDKHALAIAEKLKGRPILQPPVDESLEGYCCPDGRLHDLEGRIVYEGADSDEFHGLVVCRSCGYMYTVDRHTYKFGTYGLGCDNKQVICKSGGYVCPSCGAAVQPTEDGPAPCVCPCCGAESHDWKHYDGEIVHRDYSSGTSYDYCTRCHKKKNFIDHNTW